MNQEWGKKGSTKIAIFFTHKEVSIKCTDKQINCMICLLQYSKLPQNLEALNNIKY